MQYPVRGVTSKCYGCAIITVTQTKEGMLAMRYLVTPVCSNATVDVKVIENFAYDFADASIWQYLCMSMGE